MQMQALQNRFIAATGDAKVAADGLAFVREESERLGLSFQKTAGDFASFAASALRSGMTLQQTKDVFSSVAEAATALHLSPEQASSAFLALEQMASKGTVQMQELKLQLSQAIPGAFEIMAKAMNVSVAKLNQMMAAGNLLSSDALPKLGEELHRQFGGVAVQAADSAQAAVNRLGNSLFDLQTKLADAGILDAFTTAVKNLTASLNDPDMVNGLKGFAELMGQAANAALLVASAVGKANNAIDDGADMAASMLGKRFSEEVALVKRQEQSGLGEDSQRLIDKITAQGGIKFKPLAMGDTGGLSNEGAFTGGEGTVSGDYSLGKNAPPEETDAQKKARERAAKKAQDLKEQMQAKVANVGLSNAREMDPSKAAALEAEKQQKILDDALAAKAISEEKYREDSLNNELAYQQKLTDIRQQATDLEVGMREKALDNIMGLLQVFAGKNKAIAMAMLVFDKARAIAQAIMETHVAAAAALKYDPTGATSAYVTTLGYANVAAIAATGIAQLATMGGGGGISSSSSGSSGGFSSSADATTATPAAVAPNKSVFIALNGDDAVLYSKNQIRKLLQGINDALSDGSKLNVVVSS